MRSNTVIIKYCLASVLTLTVFLSCLGCTGGTAAETDAGYLPESSPFSEEQNDEMMAYGFGLVSPDPDTNIVYDGEPVEVEYYIDNDSVPISTGMLMFVNGIPQPYSTDGDAEAYMHIHEAPANEKATVKIKFTPVCGREGDTLSVRFLSILNPQKRPDKKEYIFGHTNSITTFLPLYMEMKKDAPSEPAEFPRLDPQRDMTQNEADKYIYTDRRGREVNKLRLFELTLRNPEAATMPYLPVKDGSLIFEMHCCGGPSEEYIMIPFINGTPVTSSAFPCVLTVEEGTKVYENTFSLDVGGLDPQKYGIEEYNTFYMLAIPKCRGFALVAGKTV